MASVTENAKRDDAMRADAFDWLMRVEAAPGDRVLRAELETWLSASDAHRHAYRSLERMWRVSGRLPADYADKARPDAAQTSIGTAVPGQRRRARLFAGAGMALAAALAFFFLPVVQLWLSADHLTGTAELRDVTLEDGSIVSLDASSAVAVRYAAARREVALLSGRAFFDVVATPDRPFVVVAGDVSVTVTGTAFDVRSSADSVSVAVRSGVVVVAPKRGESAAVTLTAGESLEIERDGGRVARSQVAPQDVAAWRQRRLVVDGASLAEVVEELDRHYGGVIVLGDRTLAGRRITGVFDLRHPIEALGAIVRTQHGSVTQITPYLLVVSSP